MKKSRSMKCPYLYYMVSQTNLGTALQMCKLPRWSRGTTKAAPSSMKETANEETKGNEKLSQSSESDLGVVEVEDGVDVLHERVTKKSC